MKSIKKHLLDQWNSADDECQEETGERIWNKLSERIECTKRKKVMLRVISAAAAIAACISIGLLAYTFQKPSKDLVSENKESVLIADEDGERTLPDGSKVWMEAGTEVIYYSNFINDRQVRLKGNAVFEIVHTSDASPFYVNLNDAKIKVTGTCFTVRENAEAISVILHAGKVDFMSESSGQKIHISPNQQLTYSLRDSSMSIKAFSKGISWQSGAYKLDNVSMDQLNSFLKWKYGISFDTTSLLDNKSLKLNGTIGLNETTKQVLDKVSYLLGVEYSFKDNVVTVY